MDLQTEYPAGVKVFARGKSKLVGRTTGGTSHCRLEGCTGLRLAVRWSDGRLTFPCTKGMDYVRGGMKIS